VYGRSKDVSLSLAARKAGFLGVALLLLTGCGARPPAAPAAPQASATAAGPAREAPPAVKRLLRLMRDRLTLMHDVARSKWNAKRPVGDPERERALLSELAEKGQEHGLDSPSTRAFFAAQIAAARRVQEADFARWRAEGQGPFREAPDLAVLRQRIDELNQELLGTLAEARRQFGDAGTREQLKAWAREVLTGEGITEDVRAAAVEGLEGD
jgi:chorismate mutase